MLFGKYDGQNISISIFKLGDQHCVWRIQYRNRIYDTFSVAIHDRYILYDRWRYRYPEFDNTQRWVKVPSQELSDMLVDAFSNDQNENENA